MNAENLHIAFTACTKPEKLTVIYVLWVSIFIMAGFYNCSIRYWNCSIVVGVVACI